MSRRHEERGQALVMAIGIIAVLSVVAVAVIAVSSQAGRGAKQENVRNDTLAVAEAGVANGLSVLANATNPLDPATLPASSSPEVDTVGSGTVSWYGTLSGDMWTIRARSSVPNPTGSGPLNHAVAVDVRVGSTDVNPAWNAIYSDAAGGCLTLNGTASVSEPLSARGDLCLDDSATLSGSPVNVGGTIQTTGSALVGAPGSPVAELHVAGGCRSGTSGPFSSPCTPGDGVYAAAQDASPVTLSKPPVDLDFWYANASPGPAHACTAGTFPGGFDNNGSIDQSRGIVNLFGPADYDCVAGGGRIAWTNGSPGTLVVQGAVFVDGDLDLSSGEHVLYSGRGTIYASGTVTIGGATELCAAGGSGCDFSGWAPATTMLVLVAGSSASPAFSVTGGARFQGGAYAVGDYDQDASAQVQGPRVADRVTIAGTTPGAWAPFTYLPPGTPMAPPKVVTAGWKS